MTSLTDFKALSFDCYGTLIDWETGIFDQLQILRDQLPPSHPYQDKHKLISRFDELQKTIQNEHPGIPYDDCLSQSYISLSNEVGMQSSSAEATSFGHGVGDWPAFPDTVTGLRALKQHYKLIILSNVDRENVDRTLRGPLSGIEFDGVLIAGEIGSYKPSHRNFYTLFQYVQDQYRLAKDDILHVAKSLPGKQTNGQDSNV
jgi:2-haloalkanoic acid dehalogenase type II